MKKKKIRIKDKFELNNLGNYERIYPLHPDLLEDTPENAENIALQARYDEMVAVSKDVYNESAAGGFSRKPIEIPKRELTVKSPDRGPTAKEAASRAGPGSIKKTVHKLNSLPNAASNNYYDNVGPIATSIHNSSTVPISNPQA